MDEKTFRILLILSMTLSFPVILIAMFMALEPTPSPQPAPRQPRPSAAAPTRSRPPTSQPTASKPRPPSPASQPSAPPREIAPDPAAFQELALLKKELKEQIGNLKKDRDAMLEALSQTLASRPPAEVARELGNLDDPSAASVLRLFSPPRRQEVLRQLPAERARRLEALLQPQVPR